MTRRLLALGLAGSILIALGGAVVGTAPITTARPPNWFGYLAAYAGVAALVGAWLGVGLEVVRGDRLGPTPLLRMAAAWGGPLLLSAPLYSRDVYSYVAQGRMAELGINPYLYGPVRLGDGPYLDAVSHVWQRTPAPYGPLFVGIASVVSRLAPTLMSAAFGMRLVALAGVALLAWFLPRLARQNGASESFALWLGLLNPLVLLHLVAGGHNDALMLGLLVAGLVLAGDGRVLAGVVLCTLAAAIKVPALLAVGYLVFDTAWARPTWRARGRAAAGLGAAAAGVFLAVGTVVGFGWGWVSAVGTPGRVNTWLAPTTLLGSILDGLGVDSPTRIARLVGMAGGVFVVQLLFRRRPAGGQTEAIALSLLALVVLGPVIQPWYLLWGLVLLASCGPGRLLPVLAWVSSGLAFLVMPNGSSAHAGLLLAFQLVTGCVAYATLTRAALPRLASTEPA